jgi:hypothetical protein
VIERTPYSQELALSDVYLFPKAKNTLKGTHFQSVDEVKSKIADLLNRVSADGLQHCCEQWVIRMLRCMHSVETMLKGVEINLYDFEIKPDFHTNPFT